MVKAGRVAIVPKGKYVHGTKYTRLDMVYYQNGTYVAKRDNVSVYPTVGTDNNDWMFMGEASPVMTGATTSTEGKAGLVPAPMAGEEKSVLMGDGTWSVLSQGINLLDNSFTYDGWIGVGAPYTALVSNMGNGIVKFLGSGTIDNPGTSVNVIYQWVGDGLYESLKNKFITCSFDIMSPDWEGIGNGNNYVGLSAIRIGIAQALNPKGSNAGAGGIGGNFNPFLSNEDVFGKKESIENNKWIHMTTKPIKISPELFGNKYNDYKYLIFMFSPITRRGEFYVRNCKVELGMAENTKWTPAPEDFKKVAYTGKYEDLEGVLEISSYSDIIAHDAAIQLSDINAKDDVNDLSVEVARGLILNTSPKTYKMKEDSHGRYHWGMLSNDVEKLLTQIGLSDMDFGGFIKSPNKKTVTKIVKETIVVYEDEEGNPLEEPIEQEIEFPVEETVEDGTYTYALRYAEYIAPMIKVVQDQEKRINELEQQVRELIAL